jgi:hypothetical protein
VYESEPAQDTGLSNRIDGVESFPLDYDSGAMSVHALRSALKAYGVTSSYERLVGRSMAAFKFVYDSTEAYEPLRDLYPVDGLATAARAMGFGNAHWEINKPIAEVKKLIKDEIDRGHPLIAPFLLPDAYHGFFVITGYDLERNIIYLQGAFGANSSDRTVPIPDEWDGPTVSPLGWATNPVFVIGPMPVSRSAGAEDLVLQGAVDLFKGGKLAYGEHPGEGRYIRTPGVHEAVYGLAAYEVLSRDVENEELVFDSGKEARLNFGFIWRIDSQVGQLEHDRRAGWYALGDVSIRPDSDAGLLLRQVVTNFTRASEDASSLRDVFWHEIPDTIGTAEEVEAYVNHTCSIVFKLPDDEHVRDDLYKAGRETFETPWGWLVVDDSSEKRKAAKMLVRSIEARDKNSLNLMEEIIGDPDSGIGGTEP